MANVALGNQSKISIQISIFQVLGDHFWPDSVVLTYLKAIIESTLKSFSYFNLLFTWTFTLKCPKSRHKVLGISLCGTRRRMHLFTYSRL